MIGDCQILVEKIICGGITERFVLAKSLISYLSEFSTNLLRKSHLHVQDVSLCVAERLLTARLRLSSCIKHVNVSILKLPLH